MTSRPQRTSFRLTKEEEKKLAKVVEKMNPYLEFKSQISLMRFILRRINEGQYSAITKHDEKDEGQSYLIEKEMLSKTKKVAKKQGYSTAIGLIGDVISYEYERTERGEIPFSDEDIFKNK